MKLLALLLGLVLTARPARATSALNRRGLLAILGGSATTVLLPGGFDVPSAAPALVDVPVDLGMYDRIIANEGYASLVQFIVDSRSPFAGKGLYLPNWKSLLGIGPWLKHYEAFQAGLAAEYRYSPGPIANISPRSKRNGSTPGPPPKCTDASSTKSPAVCRTSPI